ncbi:MAG TPA: hypothetical protein VN478_04980 [Clostridia bacterium]|nr:hypothetical protein [Clostridia bacterium]
MSSRQVEWLRENVEEALRTLELSSRAVQAATDCERAAREALCRARVRLDEQRALDLREQKQAKVKLSVNPSTAKNQGGLPTKPKKRRTSISSLQSRALWKPNPIETDRGGRHHLVKDEPPRAPLARLSHDDARDLWNN